MPASPVEICATALIKIGARPVTSLEGDTAEAACSRQLYPMVRDALLSAHPWSFTLTQVDLVAEAEPPVADFAYRFAFPSDHLRTVSVGTRGSGRGLAYRVQGLGILCNAQAITLSYQRRVDESELPAFFIPVLVARLAAELCIPLTENTSRAADLLRVTEAELRLARLIDSQQGTPRRIDDFTLIEARRS